MVQFVQDLQRLTPCVHGGVPVAERVMGIADVRQRVRHEVAVVDVAVQAQRDFVPSDGVGVLAEVVIGVPDAVGHGRLAAVIADAVLHPHGKLAFGKRFVVLAEQDVRPADFIVDSRDA